MAPSDEVIEKRLQHEYSELSKMAIHYDTVVTQMGAFLVAAALAAIPFALETPDWASRALLGGASLVSYCFWLLTAEHVYKNQQLRMDRLQELESALEYNNHLRIKDEASRPKRSYELQTVPTRVSRNWFGVGLLTLWVLVVLRALG